MSSIIADDHRLFQAGVLVCRTDGPCRLLDVPDLIQRFGNADHVGKIVVSVV